MLSFYFLKPYKISAIPVTADAIIFIASWRGMVATIVEMLDVPLAYVSVPVKSALRSQFPPWFIEISR